jgi:hypothetical protein
VGEVELVQSRRLTRHLSTKTIASATVRGLVAIIRLNMADTRIPVHPVAARIRNVNLKLNPKRMLRSLLPK